MLNYDLLGKFLQRMKVKPIYAFIGTVILFGVLESLIIPTLGKYPSLLTLPPQDQWVRLASIFTGFFVSPIGWAYYISTLNLPDQILSDLQSQQVVNSVSKKRLLKWKTDYEEELGGKYVAVIVLLIPGLIVAIIIRGWLFDFEPWFGRSNTIHFIFASMTTFIQFYIYSWILARELVALKWISKLFKEYKRHLILYPLHPDHAGGLSIIGRHVNKLIAFVVILGLQYAFYTYFVILYRIPYNIISVSIILGWVIYMIVVPISFFPFVIPAHNFMKEYKNAKLLKIAVSIRKISSQIEKQDNDTNTQVSPELIVDLENLKTHFNFIDKELPVWPFGASTLRQISISSLIPILNFVGSLILNYIIK